MATDQCHKSGLGTPMFSKRGALTIPAKLAFREPFINENSKPKKLEDIGKPELNKTLIYGRDE